MIESRTQSLLLILLITIASITLIFVKLEQKELTKGIAIQNKRIESSSAITNDKKTIDTSSWLTYVNREQSKFYDDDVNARIYVLGQDISKLIASHHLEINFYSIYEKEQRKFFNYTVSGEIQNCLKLIQTLSRGSLYFNVDTITIENNEGSVTMTLIFAPAVIKSFPMPETELPEPVENKVITRSPQIISTHLFRKTRIVKILDTEPIIEETINETEVIPNAPGWLSYVGFSIENETEKYYFLDTRTNKTIEIVPKRIDNLFEITEFKFDGFNILLSGEEYYVSKN